MKQLDVLIIGGGLAGLACASKLAEVSKVVIILEAQNKVGGKYSILEHLTPEDIIEYLELELTDVPTRYIEPVEFLCRYIEQFGGEIIYEAAANAIEYNTIDHRWYVDTPWGTVDTKPLVVALPFKPAIKLLSPVFGREFWFYDAIKNFYEYPEKLLLRNRFSSLFLAGDYTEPAITNSALAALTSGKHAAKSVLAI